MEGVLDTYVVVLYSNKQYFVNVSFAVLGLNPSRDEKINNIRVLEIIGRDWIPTWFALQLRALLWLPSNFLRQFSKLENSVTDLFTQKRSWKDIFNSEICCNWTSGRI